jgi:hypothetical protein
MEMSSLTYIPGFSVKFFFQPIYTDYANWAYFDKRSRTQFRKGAIQESFQQNLVDIGSVVSEEKIFF